MLLYYTQSRIESSKYIVWQTPFVSQDEVPSVPMNTHSKLNHIQLPSKSVRMSAVYSGSTHGYVYNMSLYVLELIKLCFYCAL